MTHIMVDIETLGPAGCVILSVAAVKFDDDAVAVLPFFRAFDIWDQLMRGLRVNEETQTWWREQDVEAKRATQPHDGRVLLSAGLADLAKVITRGDRVWAKGPDYDLVTLAHLYRVAGIAVPWSFRDMRDVRTILAASGVTQPKAKNKHSAADDAFVQAEAVRTAYKALAIRLEDDK